MPNAEKCCYRGRIQGLLGAMPSDLPLYGKCTKTVQFCATFTNNRCIFVIYCAQFSAGSNSGTIANKFQLHLYILPIRVKQATKRWLTATQNARQLTTLILKNQWGEGRPSPHFTSLPTSALSAPPTLGAWPVAPNWNYPVYVNKTLWLLFIWNLETKYNAKAVGITVHTNQRCDSQTKKEKIYNKNIRTVQMTQKQWV